MNIKRAIANTPAVMHEVSIHSIDFVPQPHRPWDAPRDEVPPVC